MAVPKSRISKSRRRMRRSHLKMKIKDTLSCQNCHNPKLPHRVCPHCGYYDGKSVISVKE